MARSIFGQNLAYLRNQKNLSQKKLAEILKIPLTTLAGYENAGRDPKLATLIKVSDFFNVPVDKLIRAKIFNEILSATDNELSITLPDGLKAENLQIALPLWTELLNSATEISKQAHETQKPVEVTLKVTPNNATTQLNSKGG